MSKHLLITGLCIIVICVIITLWKHHGVLKEVMQKQQMQSNAQLLSQHMTDTLKEIQQRDKQNSAKSK